MNHRTGHRIFLLSPAYAGGEQARMILSYRAKFELARKLRSKQGAPSRCPKSKNESQNISLINDETRLAPSLSPTSPRTQLS